MVTNNATTEKQFKLALELDKESLDALVGLGVSYALQDRCSEAIPVLEKARSLDAENFVAGEVYNQCVQVVRYQNPPGPQGDVLDEGTALVVVKDAVAKRLNIPLKSVIAEFDTISGKRVLSVGYLATFDPAAQPAEFANQLNQAVFAAVDAFVRADSAPLYLSVEAFGIQGQDVIRHAGRVVHRVDAVDWWSGQSNDGAFMKKWQST